MYNDKVTKSVADAVRQVVEQREPEMLNEALKGNQHKIDANKNKKIDAHDFKLLRAGKKVEEAAGVSKKKEEKFHMSLDKLVHKTFGHSPAEKMKKEGYKLNEDHFKVGDEVVCKASGMEGEIVKVDPEGEGKYYTVKREDGKTMKYAPEDLKLEKEDDEDEKEDDEKEMKESVEQLKEYESKGGVYKHQGSYGKAKGSEYGGTDWDKEESEKEEKPKRKKYGARQNFVRSKRVNEGFTDLLTQYTEGGIKSLFESLNTEVELDEESTNDEFKKELEKAKAKSSGTIKADVAKAKVVANDEVRESLEDFSFEELEEFMMSEEFQQLDELSKDTMRSYMDKVQGSGKGSMNDIGKKYGKALVKGNTKDQEKHANKANTRMAGMGRAFDRLNKEEVEQIEELEEFMMSEEFQQLDELSRKTLTSYMQKTAPGKPDSAKAKLQKASDMRSRGYELSQAGKDKEADKLYSKAKQTVTKADNRRDARAKIMGVAGKSHHLVDEGIELEEGLLDTIKRGFASGMQQNLKKSIKPEHHHKYDFSSVKSVSDAKGVLVKAKQSGHLAEQVEQIEERELSDAEMQKREKYVKSMKKNLAGFKERYGKRGKEVLYATATKMSKED